MSGEITGAVVIEVEDLRMRYGSMGVLNGVSLRVQRGEVVALLGPNGAGKSTTIEILEGFRGRSAGEVTVLGVDPFGGDEAWRARVGIVLQSWRDHGKWRVGEFLANQGSLYAPYATPRVRHAYDGRGIPRSCSLRWVCLIKQASRSVVSRVGNGAGSMWRWAWSGDRSCCFWTSPPRGWTRKRVSLRSVPVPAGRRGSALGYGDAPRPSPPGPTHPRQAHSR